MKIETKDLCIGYDRAIVNNINISVNDSETVVLIGPNGAGKTGHYLFRHKPSWNNSDRF